MIGLIVAHDVKGGIGIDGKLPWKVSADIDHFWKTIGQMPVIVGRKTWEGSKKYFLKRRPNATHIVISRGEPQDDQALWLQTAEQALNAVRIKNFAWVCGGSEIYKLFEPHVDITVETAVNTVANCDCFVKEHWKNLHFEPYKTIHFPLKDGEPSASVHWSYRRADEGYSAEQEKLCRETIDKLCQL